MSLVGFFSRKPAECGDERSLSPSHLFPGQISATTRRYKNTFLQSSSLYDSSSLSCVAKSLLLVDIKSLRTDTGFKGIICQVSFSICIQQQQQHADVSCVWSSSLILVTREQGSRGGMLCLSLHLLLHYGYPLSFSEGQRKNKNNK